MNITSFCIKRPVTTFMFFAILVLLGSISASRLPIDLYPEISMPVVFIGTSYSGAAPEEVEQLVTVPIEQAVSTINKVKSITSVSQEGFSRVLLFFDWGVDLDEIINDIRANLDRAARRLPDNADSPTLFRFNPSAMAIMTVGLSGNMEESYLRKLADEEISYQLQKADGVASVDVQGGSEREIMVELKRERLSALGISINQVSSAIRNENIMLPAGNLDTGAGEFMLRTSGELQNIEEIKDIVVANHNGIPVLLKDLGVVEEKKSNTEYLVRIDGREGIVLSLQKQSGSNTVAVVNRVKKILRELSERYPDIRFRVLNDGSLFIRDSVNGVASAAVLGAIFAGFVLLFFLHNLRATLVAAVVMPVSILSTLILAYFGNMTLNSISLGGLALGVGMLVDNTVVVIDNISRKLDSLEIGPDVAALEGTKEMGAAITASTLTTICVFFPLVYISGQTGIIFKELAYMVIFSLICSLVVAITLIPMLSAKYLKNRELKEKRTGSVIAFLINLQNRWESSYRQILSWCLGHKTRLILICLLVFLTTLGLWPLIGTEAIVETDEGIISVRVSLPPGTKFEETNAVMLGFEKIASELPELDNMEISINGYGRRGGSNRADMTLRLVDRAQRYRSTSEVMREVQTKLQFPGANIRVYARNSLRMLYGWSDSPISVDIRGYDQELARQTSKLVMNKLDAIPGVTNVSISREEEQPEFSININRKRAADLGISVAQIAEAIQSSFEGEDATTIRKDGQELQVRVTLQEEDRKSLEDLKQVLVTGRNNRIIPLSSLININLSNSPVSIERTDRERTMTVEADLNGRDLAEAMTEIKAEINKINLPPGISIYYSGDYEEQQKGFAELRTALILALLLVYMIMASQFESLLDPLIIMFSVPFTLGGVLLVLLLTDTPLNNQVYIGLIVLGGIVVNNAIVLISYFRLLMERGMSLEEAVLNGATSRLRPILMTTITTVLGLVPLAIETGAGTNMQAPMARAVIGGLIFSSVLTLVLIPVIFMAVESFLAKLKENRLGKKRFKTGGFILIILAFIVFNQNPALAEVEKRILNLRETVNLVLEASEEGKIIASQRESILSEFREAQGAKGLDLYSEATVNSSDSADAHSIGLNAEKTIPLTNFLGKKSYSDMIAEQNKEIDLLSNDLRKTNLILEVITAYQNELLALRDLELAEKNFNRAQYFYEEVKVKSRLGLTSITDETGVEAQLSGAETGFIRAKQNYELTRFALRQLLGFEDSVDIELVPLKTVEIANKVSLEELIRVALNNRLELRQANLKLSRSETLLKMAKLSERLGISLTWSFEKDNFNSGVSLSNQKQNVSGEWGLSGNAGISTESVPEDSGLTLVLRWDFLDGRVRKEQIKQAELLVNQQKEEEKKTKKNIEYQVKEGFFNYLDLENRLRSNELQLRHNRTNLESLQAKYRAGLASIKDILEAQLLLNQAEVQYEETKSDLYLAYIKLLNATGQFTLESL